ncbi:MAG: M24 family metallopeptidase [Actinomycetota bacterium]
MSYQTRVDSARVRLDDLGCDALLVTNLTNVRYLTGFSGSNGQVLIGRDEAVFFSDGRYAARAATLVEGAEIAIYKDKLGERLTALLESTGVERLGVEGATVTLAQWDELAESLAVELVTTKEVIEDLRRVKDETEIEALRRAVAIGDAAFTWMVERLSPGMTERGIALDLEVYMRSNGAEDVSFEPIVGTGPLAAHIHHTPSDRALEKGDLVLMDFGALADGYHSDLTRTVVVGPASDEQREVYDVVRRAQQAGIDALVGGAGAKAVDTAARSVVVDAGYGDTFNHGLGHGVGLDIHEAPRMSDTTTDVLRTGEVVTVEPGIYLSDRGGVRIEDCVLITDGAAAVLGSAPKDKLIEV